VILELYWENLVVLIGESCSSFRQAGSGSCMVTYNWAHCSIPGGDVNVYKILLGKLEENKPFERLKCR
jgi:hypothetical protein